MIDVNVWTLIGGGKVVAVMVGEVGYYEEMDPECLTPDDARDLAKQLLDAAQEAER